MSTRTDLVSAVFADVLPPELPARSTKAVFDAAMWTPAARRFAAEWSGLGIPDGIVDPDRLRAQWRRAAPDARSATLIQAAWLHDHG